MVLGLASLQIDVPPVAAASERQAVGTRIQSGSCSTVDYWLGDQIADEDVAAADAKRKAPGWMPQVGT
jgi:hypothetical protein